VTAFSLREIKFFCKAVLVRNLQGSVATQWRWAGRFYSR